VNKRGSQLFIDYYRSVTFNHCMVLPTLLKEELPS